MYLSEVKQVPFTTIIQSNGIPVLDVRSPSEFESGHVPGALSFPLFDDDERAEIGTLYKQESQDAAIEKGLEFVGPKMLRLVQSAKELAPNKEVYIYCWRGGMRSGAVKWLLEFAGFKVYKIPGGYKAYRTWVGEVILQYSKNAKWHVLGGMTGSAKTEILLQMKDRGAQVIDLEGLAHHKGSAFGHFLEEKQPSTEHFMNLLVKELVQLDWKRTIWIEDESRLIGKVVLPPELMNAIFTSPITVIEKTVAERAAFLASCYGEAEYEEFERSFNFIKKRLGGPEVQLALEEVRNGNLSKAAEIALKYYDKAYRHALDKKREKQEQNFVDVSGKSVEEIAELLINKEE
ncbi:tRNA 2-selenouridine(34) synthase MnmH [Phaeocystidibacter marisrubri]|uniref:tRNA 2-selenouridine(34) synthase MnmH n=1 Tax=Phaeocystidibacter marisrubri TaxID=1577780 RepID=A0A6L3ZD20_9FLAO|nr:tRNA 2-selenouridine(34) synthase MnmH [Phaeocystidibacter marisrubri]KAB2815570.1 tRNA 2-selenouridine(34) synthase MnmH [Phaeocystidibacter marisrubri]GGH64594.1 tRNA 2-selenouridine synthase [Phaeocystidibacter marisrubri]